MTKPADRATAAEREEERLLVQRIRRGDSKAWGVVYDRHAAALYRRTLLPRLGDRAAAEDALADTFRTAMEKFDLYEEREVGLYFWLSRIAHNKAMDMHRAQKTSGRKIADLRGLLTPLATSGERADELLELAASGRDVEKLVAEVLGVLNPRYRRAIELRFFEEKAREECALDLGVKLGTFDVVLLRALRSFRERWDEILSSRKDQGHDGKNLAAFA